MWKGQDDINFPTYKTGMPNHNYFHKNFHQGKWDHFIAETNQVLLLNYSIHTLDRDEVTAMQNILQKATQYESEYVQRSFVSFESCRNTFRKRAKAVGDIMAYFNSMS